MIEIRQLSRNFKILGRTKEVLSDINLTLPDTGLVCVCGKSGSGKSTLLNIIGLQDKASSGEILYNGKNILRYSEREKNEYRRSVAGRISQDYDLVPELTVFNNCELAAGISSSAENKAELISRSLKSVGLEGYEKRKVSELSGGEKQRVAIARAIAGNVSLLLCDEPTGNLDPDTSKEVMNGLKALSRSICVIMVTHNRTLAEKYADRLIDLNDGRITADRSLTETDEEKNTEAVTLSEADNEKAPEKNASYTSKKSKEIAKNKKNKLGPKYIFRFALLNLNRHKVLSCAVMLLLAFLISALLTASYMASYSKAKSIATNLNRQKIASVNVTIYRQQLWGDEPSLDFPYKWKNIDELKAKLYVEHPDLSFGDLYSFARNFYDFSDAENLENGFYHCIAFTDFIVVSDFSKFSYELDCGSYPSKEGEVLIFDYMAENMLYFSIFDDVHSYEDLLGYTLTDDVTGFSMTVSGILKSNFRNFEYVGDSNSFFSRDKDYYVANSCLSKYRCVFGGSEFAERIQQTDYYLSYEEAEFECTHYVGEETEKVSISKRNSHKINVYSKDDALAKGISFVYNEGEHFYIRDTVLAEVLGVPLETINKEFCENLFNYETSEIIASFTATSLSTFEPSYLSDYFDSHAVISGVFHSDIDDSVSFVDCCAKKSRWDITTGKYAGTELLLSNNVEKNAEMIAELIPEIRDASFWQDDPEKVEEGFTVYTYFDNILSILDEYLQVNNKLFNRYSWLVAIFMAAAVFTFAAVSIKKNERTIGILRSLGLSRGRVMAIYASSALMVIVTASLLSLAGAQLMLLYANDTLSEGFGISVSIYSVNFVAIAKAFAIVGISTAVAFLVDYLWLVIRKPISLIYGRKD